MDFVWLTYSVLNCISITLKVLLIAFLVLVVWIQLSHSKLKQEIRRNVAKSSMLSEPLPEEISKHKLTIFLGDGNTLSAAQKKKD